MAMVDGELAGLSREELLALVRRQQAELAAREAAIERRDEKIRELEEELAQFRRPAKTPENSSVPPSRGQKANRVERRGRKCQWPLRIPRWRPRNLPAHGHEIAPPAA